MAGAALVLAAGCSSTTAGTTERSDAQRCATLLQVMRDHRLPDGFTGRGSADQAAEAILAIRKAAEAEVGGFTDTAKRQLWQELVTASQLADTRLVTVSTEREYAVAVGTWSATATPAAKACQAG